MHIVNRARPNAVDHSHTRGRASELRARASGARLGLSLLLTLGLACAACELTPLGSASAQGKAAAKAQSTSSPSGRKPMSKRTYTKPSDAELRKKLTPLQYEVSQKEATEPAFRNPFHDN